MPVSKFRSIEDMPTRVEVTSDQLVVRIRALWARAFALARPLDFRGVTRYASIEQASDARTRATLERMRETRR
jgi:hypothetical protein